MSEKVHIVSLRESKEEATPPEKPSGKGAF